MKTPGSRLTLAFLLLVQVFTMQILTYLEEQFPPTDVPPPHGSGPGFLFLVAWGFMNVFLVIPFLRLWPVYPGRVPLSRVWRGLFATYSETPIVAVGHASFASFVLVLLVLYDTFGLVQTSLSVLILNWIYVSLSIGAVSATMRR